MTTSMLGLSVGALLPLVASVKEPAVYGVSLLLGGAVGVGGALFVGNTLEMSVGQASLVTSATLLGTWNMVALSNILNPFLKSNSLKLAVGLTLLGGGFGYVSGFLAGRFVEVTLGRVAMATSVAAFASAYTGLVLGIARVRLFSIEGVAGWLSLIAAADLAYLGGWLLQSKLRLSRPRVLLMSLGGVVGAAAGGAIAALAHSTLQDERGVMGLLLGFSLVGVASAAILTRHFRPEGDLKLTRGLTTSGALLQFQGKRWALGVPLPSLAPEYRDGSKPGMRVEVPLVKGAW